MFERMWRDDYFLADDVSVEQECNYLLYGILDVQIG